MGRMWRPDPTLPFPQNLEPARYRKGAVFNQDGSLDAVGQGAYITTGCRTR